MKTHQAEYRTDTARFAVGIAARDKGLIIAIVGLVPPTTTG